MKKIVQVSFGLWDRSADEARRILGAAGHEPEKGVPLYYLQLVDGTSELDNLRTALREHGVDWSEQIDYSYTDKELQSAPLVYPVLRRAETGDGGPTYGTRFDLSNACPACGTGARQIGPLRLKASEIPRTGQMFQTLDHEWLFTKEAADRLTPFAGIELRQAVDAGSEKPLNWFQPIATQVLPPMSGATTGLKVTVGCKRCRRDGHFHTSREPLLIAYDFALDVERLPDVAVTFEHFGWSGLREPFEESHFACPLFVIKPSLIAALREARVRLLQFYPVSIVESAE